MRHEHERVYLERYGPERREECLPFPTLFANPAWEGRCYERPILGSMGLNHLHDFVVLRIRPRSLDKLRVEDLLPPVQTLDISSVLKVRSNVLPVFGLKIEKVSGGQICSNL